MNQPLRCMMLPELHAEGNGLLQASKQVPQVKAIVGEVARPVDACFNTLQQSEGCRHTCSVQPANSRRASNAPEELRFTLNTFHAVPGPIGIDAKKAIVHHGVLQKWV